MKKIYITCLALASLMQANTFKSLEVQIEDWNANSYGTFQREGTVIDLKERGLKKKLSPSVVLDLKGISNYTNFKVGYTKIKNKGKKVLSSDMKLNGLNFDKGEMQKSKYDLDMFDAIYYIDQPSDGLVHLSFGIGFRYIKGSFQSKTCPRGTTASFHKFLTVGYMSTEITPSWAPFKLINQVIISPANVFYIDTKTAVKTKIYKNISLEVGYRYNRLEASGKYNANIKSDGLYGAVSYKFKF